MADTKELRHQRWWDFTCHYFGYQVVVLRERRGWTVAELATQSGCSVKRIAQIEDGDLSNATLRDVTALAVAFDVAPLIRFAAPGTPPTYGEETQTVNNA